MRNQGFKAAAASSQRAELIVKGGGAREGFELTMPWRAAALRVSTVSMRIQGSREDAAADVSK
jgi:hypothetical protein